MQLEKQKQNKSNYLNRDKIVNDLIKGEFICTYHSDNMRDIVYNARKVGMPIETITCQEDKCKMKGKRKHKAYYYEWALERRR